MTFGMHTALLSFCDGYEMRLLHGYSMDSEFVYYPVTVDLPPT